MDRPWLYLGEEITSPPPDMLGFVYMITNMKEGKFYIGKKIFYHGKKESDWRTYWGSSNRLHEDLARLGHGNFRREIIELCGSKSHMQYAETKAHFDRGVLFEEAYYNQMISCRIKANKKLTKLVKG